MINMLFVYKAKGVDVIRLIRKIIMNLHIKTLQVDFKPLISGPPPPPSIMKLYLLKLCNGYRLRSLSITLNAFIRDARPKSIYFVRL